MLNNENKEICSKCGGACCQALPGINSPQDFNCSEKEILEALKSGKYALDYWDGEFENTGIYDAYFIRPAIQGKEGQLIDPSWGGFCTFWTPEDGCELSFKQRPLGCKSLLVNIIKPGHCTDGMFGKKEAVKAWLPYQEILIECIKKLN